MTAMITKTRALALVLAACFGASTLPVALASAVVAAPQDDEEKPDKRPEIKEALAAFKKHVSKRGDEDVEAIAIIDQMLQEFPESGPKDRKAIAKEIGAVFKLKRKPSKENILDNKLFNAAAIALGRMGPESVKDLVKWSDHKNFAKNVDVKCRLIRALGKTEDEDAVEPLIDFLGHHDAQVQAAAAEGLGNYGEAEQKERKKIFKKMLDQLTRVKNIIDVNQVDPIERKRYDIIAGPMLTSLQVLSGNDEIRDPTEFRRWWNKNKKKDWDEGNKD